jgi:hypothetical protein
MTTFDEDPEDKNNSEELYTTEHDDRYGMVRTRDEFGSEDNFYDWE